MLHEGRVENQTLLAPLKAMVMRATPEQHDRQIQALLNRPNVRPHLPNIACPTLVITTEGSGLATVDDTRAWQQTIPDSELLVLPGDSYHVAASDAAQCAQATLEFIERRDPDD